MPLVLKIAANFYLLAGGNEKLSFKQFLENSMPSGKMLALFPVFWLVCKKVMHGTNLMSNKMIFARFFICGGLGVFHLSLYAYVNFRRVLEIKKLISSSKEETEKTKND